MTTAASPQRPTVLGVDPGLVSCGVAVLPGARTWVLHPPRGAWPEVAAWLVREVITLARTHGATVAAVETVVWHGPRRGALALAATAGAIFGGLVASGVVTHPVVPRVVKRLAATPGVCRLGRTPHERDALAAALVVRALTRVAAYRGGVRARRRSTVVARRG